MSEARFIGLETPLRPWGHPTFGDWWRCFRGRHAYQRTFEFCHFVKENEYGCSVETVSLSVKHCAFCGQLAQTPDLPIHR